MPQQLIYTSAPRGVVAGRSGHCTVARSAAMREALVLQLEKLSYYQHLSLSGGRERPIFACRVIDLRGTRFHVLTRIQDAGLDFTGRTNFVAHHLVFTPEEIRQYPAPPVILRDWPGWMTSWTGEPRLLENETWTELSALAGKTSLPAQTWQQVTGDAANGYGLLEARGGAAFRVDDQTDSTVLTLLAESLELLEVRDPRRDFRATAWQYTFTTSLQEQDNPADFRWRCVHSDNPAARTAGPDCRPFSAVKAGKCSAEEAMLARSGRQPPRFVLEPFDTRIVEGETARLQVKAEGAPSPAYQWFTVDRAGNAQLIAGATGAELDLTNPPMGQSRYLARASNSAGEATTNIATLSVEQKLRLAQGRPGTGTREPVRVVPSYVRSEEDIDNQRQRLQSELAERRSQKKRFWGRLSTVLLAMMIIVAASAVAVNRWMSRKLVSQPVRAVARKNEDGTNQSAALLTTNPVAQIAQPSPLEATPPNKEMFLTEGNKSSAFWTSTFVGGTDRVETGIKNGVITIVGRGTTLYTNSDKFVFVSLPSTNLVEFVARLSSVAQNTNSCECGIMLRESSNSNAPFVFLGFTETSIVWTKRLSAGAPCSVDTVSRPRLPIFLRVRRDGNCFSGAISTDGKKWENERTNEISMANANYLVGFAVTSGKPEKDVTACFDNITNGVIDTKP